MNKTLLYIGIGIGVIYLLKRIKSNKNESQQKLATNSEQNKIDPLIELQNETATQIIDASERRDFQVEDFAKKIMRDYFKTIKDKNELNDYQKMASKEMDRIIELAQKPNANMKIVKAEMRQKIGITYERYMELNEKMSNFVMPKIMASSKSNFFGFDDGL